MFRIMREDRGFLCANEMQLRYDYSKAQLALFRHKLPGYIFFETVQLSKRWTGPMALGAGIVQETAAVDELAVAAARKQKNWPL